MQKLAEASQELDKTLRIYLSTVNKDSKPVNVLSHHLLEIVPPTAGLPSTISPEGLTTLLNAVVLHRTQVKTLSTKVSQTFGKIYPLTNFVLNLGIAAGEAFQPAKAVVASLAILLNYVENERARSGGFLQQLQKITYQCSRIAELQKSITSAREWNHLVVKKSTQLLTAIVIYFRDCIIYFNRSSLQNLGKSMLVNPQSHSATQGLLDSAIAEYDQALLLQIAISTLSAGSKAASTITEKEGSPNRSEIITWLDSSYWETEAQYVSACDRRSADSSYWMLELDSFKRWRRKDSRGLWLSGAPGFGKSMLAAYMIQLLKAEDPNTIVLYFFCRAANSKLNTVESIIRTLAAQLITVTEGTNTTNHFRALKEEKFDSKDVSLLFRRLIHEPLSDFIGYTGTKYIIIDGIDECIVQTETTAILPGTNLYRFLDLIQNETIQFMITSRPMPVPMDQFGSLLHHRLTHENSEDISHMVLKKISQSVVLQRGFGRLGKPNPEVFLTEKANGSFLWVTTVLGLLDRNNMSMRTFEGLLANVPDVLGQTYHDILDKLEQSGSLELTRVLLRCVLFNRPSLTIESIEAAIHIIYGEVFGLREFIESECGSILTIMSLHGGKDIVQIGHETFRSFITNRSMSGPRFLSAFSGHMQLTVACLETLIASKQDDHCETLLEYATAQWANHFAACQLQTTEGIDDSDLESSLIQRLFLGLHKLLTDADLFCVWLKKALFLSQTESNPNLHLKFFCYHLYDLQEMVSKWVKSLEVAQLCLAVSELELKSQDKKEARKQPDELSTAMIWRRNITNETNTDLRTFICKTLTRTWLTTNWRDSNLCHSVFLQTKKTAEMLLWDRDQSHLQEQSSDQPQNRKDRVWRGFTPSDYSSTTVEDLKKLAELGDFAPSVGVQAGNYAFGCIHAKYSICARLFISALDEHPDWWYFSFGLGDWYYRNNDKERAVKAWETAMKSGSQSSAVNNYWIARSEICLERGDIDGAVGTLREGEALASEQGSFRYWDTMARVWKDQKKWDKVKEIYTDALKKRSFGRDEWWMGLARAHEEDRDWKGELKTLLLAMQDVPANSDRFANKICSLAAELSESMLYAPATGVLEAALQKTNQRNPKRVVQYQTSLAKIYLAARQWRKAADLYEILLDGKIEVNLSQKRIQFLDGLSCAYVAMFDDGHDNLKKAITAFEAARDLERKPSDTLPHTVALAHMITGHYPNAVRVLKKCISKAHSTHPTDAADVFEAGMLMKLQLHLGQCYHAMDRQEDGDEAFQAGINLFETFKEDYVFEKKVPTSSDGETPIWRYFAHPPLVYGELLEQMGRGPEAVPYYKVAERFMSRTSFVGDDDVLEWEFENCVRALRRVRGDNLSLESMLTTTDGNVNRNNWKKLLELQICSTYRTEWYSYMASEMPRYRGGEGSWVAVILSAGDGKNEARSSD